MKNEKIRDKMRDESYTCSCCFQPSQKKKLEWLNGKKQLLGQQGTDEL